MTLGPKTKIAMAVAGVLAVGALALTAVAHSSSAAAHDSAAGDSSSFPGLLFAASPQPSQIATNGSTIGDNTTGIVGAPASGLDSIAAALQGALAQITANRDVSYQTNAASLFAALPKTLAGSSIEDYLADFNGFNVHAHVIYHSSATPDDQHHDTGDGTSIGGSNTSNALGGIAALGAALLGSVGGGGAGSAASGSAGLGGEAGTATAGFDFGDGGLSFGLGEGGAIGGASDAGAGAGSSAAGGAADGGAGDGGGGDGGGGGE